MADSAHLLPFPEPRLAVPDKLLEGRMASLAVTLVGAGAIALFISAPWSIALVAAAAVLVLSAMENEAFLLFVVFLMPLGWMLPGTTMLRSAHVVLHALVVVGFFSGKLLRRQLRMRSLLNPVASRASLLFFCAALASTMLAKGEPTRESTRALANLLTFVGFYFVVLGWLNSPLRIRKVLWALLLSTMVTALFALYQLLAGGFTSLWLHLYPPEIYFAEWGGRASSFLNAGNSLAGYLNLVLPFALACYVLARGKWKTAGGGTFGLGLLALLSTQSIGGLLALVAILVLAVFGFVRCPGKRLTLLAGLCVLICLTYLWSDVLNPVHSEQYVQSDAVTRFWLWGEAWNLFRSSPVLGVGWGDFPNLYDSTLPFFAGAGAAHNTYLQLLAETGLLGFAAFFYLVAGCWRQARVQWHSSSDALDRALAFGVLGALLSVLVHGSVDFLFQASPQFGTLFWTLLALLAATNSLQHADKMHAISQHS